MREQKCSPIYSRSRHIPRAFRNVYAYGHLSHHLQLCIDPGSYFPWVLCEAIQILLNVRLSNYMETFVLSGTRMICRCRVAKRCSLPLELLCRTFGDCFTSECWHFILTKSHHWLCAYLTDTNILILQHSSVLRLYIVHCWIGTMACACVCWVGDGRTIPKNFYTKWNLERVSQICLCTLWNAVGLNMGLCVRPTGIMFGNVEK